MLIKEQLKKVPLCKCPEFTNRELERCSHIVSAQVLTVPSCGEIFIADYFSIDGYNLQARFFCDKKNYITYLPQQDKWTTNPLKSIFPSESIIPCKEHDEDVAGDFLQIEKVEWRTGYLYGYGIYQGIHGICEQFIYNKNRKKAERAYDLKQARKTKHMSMFPEKYPADVLNYLDKVAFKNTYIFFSKLDKKHKRTGVCSYCGKKFVLPADIKHKSKTECPKCHRTAIFFADRYSPKKETVIFCYPFLYDNQLLIQWDYAEREYCNKKPIFNFNRLGRTLFLTENGKQKIKSYGWKYTQYYWGSGWADYGKNPIFRQAYVYPNNLKEIFGEKFCNVNLYEMFREQPYPMDFVRLIDNLKNEPVTEYLCKLKLYKFASSVEMPYILNTDGKNFSEVFKIKQNYLSLYQKENVTVAEHKIIENSREFVSSDLLYKYRNSGISSSNDILIDLLEYMTLTKAINYIKKQVSIIPQSSEYQVCIWLRDYIDMCKFVGVNLNKNTIFPANIKEAHDRFLSRYRNVKAEKEEKESREALTLINDFFKEYTVGDLTVKVPKCRKDFIIEGEELHHCVGMDSYYKRHIKGERMIFFIRKTDNPDKPLYTAEIDMHKFIVLQLYGINDTVAPKKIKHFTDEFAKWLRQMKTVLAKTG